VRATLTLAACLILAGAVALPAAPTTAQEGLNVRANTTALDFPGTLTFHLEASAPVLIEKAELRYRVGDSACGQVTAAAFPTLTPGADQSLTWVWDLRERGGLPVGAQLTYQWVLTGGGRTLTTPERTFTYEDSRFDWRSIEGTHVAIQWYQGDAAFAQGLRATAEAGIARLEASTGALPARQVRIRVYARAVAMRGAFVFGPEWVGGVAYPEHSLVSLGIAPGDGEWAERALVHELSHVVVAQATASCGGAIPAWLNEGLAVYAEGLLEDVFTEALEEAIAADRAFGVRSLAGAFPYGRADATLAYAQSHDLVRFLIETHGPERMDALFAAFRQSGAIDRALMQTYGFDQRGLDEAWRISRGLAPRALPTPTPAPSATSTPTPVATPPPVPAGTPTPAPGGGGGCNRGSGAPGDAAGGLAVAVLGVSGLLAFRRFLA
jgi:hypothetical protein